MKKELWKKGFLFPFLLFFGISLIFTYFSVEHYHTLTKEVNAYVGSIVKKVEERYPAITEEEIRDLLNGKGETSKILEETGINEDNIAMISLEKEQKKSYWITMILFLLMDFLFLLSFVSFYLRREKKVKELTKQVKEISKKNYNFPIEKEEEGEISYLRNELYKITIMLKEESENAKKEKEALKTLVEDISHQLKTPLTSIRILLDNLENTKMEEEMRREFLHDISVQLEKMNTLTISLLKLARFDAGVVTLEKKEVKVKDLLEELQENYSVLLELHNQKLVIEGDSKITMNCDSHWELEALGNILKNAIDHGKENSTIFITFSETPFYTTIEIRNEGEGISKKDQKHIFDRFYKSKNASKDSIGIGLSLAKAIVEKEGGTIRLESIPNQYTTFQIKYEKK